MDQLVNPDICPITFFGLKDKKSGSSKKARADRERLGKRDREFMEYVKEGRKNESKKS
jgi:hypothetical protein